LRELIEKISKNLFINNLLLFVLCAWEDTFFDQLLPELDPVIEIDFEDADGGPSSRRQTHEHRAIPPKMPRPLMTAGIEQRDNFPGLGVDAGDVWPFVTIARETAQAEIAGPGRSIVVFRDDVIDFEGDTVARLGHLAVFATVAGATPYEFQQ
jgi:hypothetical protein